MSSQTPSSLSNFIDLIFPGKIKEPTEKLLLIDHWSIIKMGYHIVDMHQEVIIVFSFNSIFLLLF